MMCFSSFPFSSARDEASTVNSGSRLMPWGVAGISKPANQWNQKTLCPDNSLEEYSLSNMTNLRTGTLHLPPAGPSCHEVLTKL
ncbi:hypothetical protein AOLI_G00085120 [Acnodon oligacanthus]